MAAKDRFLIVEAGPFGPVKRTFHSLEIMAATLVSWGRRPFSLKTATVWKRTRDTWAPMFRWQHEGD